MPAEEGRGQRCQASGVLPPLDPRCLGQNGCSHGRDNHPGQRSLGGGEGPRPVKRQGKEVSGWTPPTGGARARAGRPRPGKEALPHPTGSPRDGGKSALAFRPSSPPERSSCPPADLPRRGRAWMRRPRPLALQTWEVHTERPLDCRWFTVQQGGTFAGLTCACKEQD